MKLTKAQLVLHDDIIRQIDQFDVATEEDCYTDMGDAWAMLNWIRSRLSGDESAALQYVNTDLDGHVPPAPPVDPHAGNPFPSGSVPPPEQTPAEQRLGEVGLHQRADTYIMGTFEAVYEHDEGIIVAVDENATSEQLRLIADLMEGGAK